VRREGLDRLLVFHRRQLEAILFEFVTHYNQHRPHRSLAQRAPLALERARPPINCPDAKRLRRTDKLGGLVHEYRLAA
jgi:transposase InsO family protein